MDKIVGFLVKAVGAAAAMAVLMAIGLMIWTGSLFALPLFVLAAVAGTYSWLVHSQGVAVASKEAPLKQRILVS
jgi:hypothetical protein